MIWYKQPIDDVYTELNSTINGLSSDNLTARQIKYGANRLVLKGDPFWKVVVEPFKSVFVAVLLAAAGISYISNEYLDGTIVLIIVFINAVIYWSQQYATDRRSWQQNTSRG